MRVLLPRGELHLRLREPVGAARGLVEQRRHLGHDLGEVLADRLLEIDAEQRRGRAVGQVDAARAIEPDDPGGDAGQHRLGEPAPLVELPVRLDQLALLALDLVGHAVEGAAQRGEFVVFLALGHARGKIAAAHPLGRGDQPADRIGELGGEMDPDRHRGDQKQHRHHQEDQREGDLKARSLTFQLLVLRGGALGLLRCD